MEKRSTSTWASIIGLCGTLLAGCGGAAAPPDMATGPDLATPDLATGADLAAPADLMAPPDLAPPAAVGTYEWAQGFGATGGISTFDTVRQVSVDAAGNLLVAGSFNGTSFPLGAAALVGSGGDTPFLAKLEPSGAVLWSRVMPTFVSALAPEDAGHFLVVLGFSADVTIAGQTFKSRGGSDFLVVRFDSDGNALLAKQLGGVGRDGARSIAVGPGGAIGIGGTFIGTTNYGGSDLVAAGNQDSFLLMLDASLAHVWSKVFGGPDTTDEGCNAVAFDSQGNFVVAGTLGGAVDLGGGMRSGGGKKDAYLASFRGSDGAHRWSNAYGGTGDDAALQVVVDRTDGVHALVYAEGHLDFGGGDRDAGTFGTAVVRLGGSGAHLSSEVFPGFGGNGLVLDPWEEELIGGTITDGVDLGGGALKTAGYDGVVLKRSAGGALLWARTFQSSGSDVINGVAVDSLGRVYAGGYFGGKVTVATSPTATTLSLVSANDALIARLSP